MVPILTYRKRIANDSGCLHVIGRIEPMTHEGKSWAAIKRDTITTAKASRSAYGLVRDVDDGCPSRLSRRRASERKGGNTL